MPIRFCSRWRGAEFIDRSDERIVPLWEYINQKVDVIERAPPGGDLVASCNVLLLGVGQFMDDSGMRECALIGALA